MASESFALRAERGDEAGVIRGAMVIEIVGAERDAREAIQQIIFFVRGAIRADEADRGRAVLLVHLLQPARNFLERIFPAGGFEFAIAANERLADALGMLCEIEAEAALGAEKIAVDAGKVAIVGAQNFVVANAESGLAAVRAVRAGGGRRRSFPTGASCSDRCRW